MTASFPIVLPPSGGGEINGQDPVYGPLNRAQYGAICWRRIGTRIEVLLITSRDTGRWVIPKGWPIDGLSPEASAAREAFEEAGVEGRIGATCVGLYSYEKGLDTPTTGPRVCVPCVVAVYPLQVKGLRDRFPERGERRRKWFSPKKAALKVAEPALQTLLSGFEDFLKTEDLPHKKAKIPDDPKSKDATLDSASKTGPQPKQAKA